MFSKLQTLIAKADKKENPLKQKEINQRKVTLKVLLACHWIGIVQLMLTLLYHQKIIDRLTCSFDSFITGNQVVC